MDVERWLKRYNDPPPDPGSRNSIEGIGHYDREDIEAMKKAVKDYRVARERIMEKVERTGGSLVEDGTMVFFKVDPRLLDKARMDPEFLLNRAITEEVQNTPECERLRMWTTGDIINTAVSFSTMVELYEELFDKHQAEAKRRSDQIEQILQALRGTEQQQANLDELIERWQQGGIFDPDGDEMQGAADAAEALGQQIADLQGDLAQAMAELDKMAHDAARGAMPGMRQAMAEQADQHEQIADACRGFGMDPGELRRLPANERLKLAEKLDRNEKFKRLSQLIGPMMRLAETEQRRKVYHSFEEVYDIETGGDISRIVPSEMLNLLRPGLKAHFMHQWIENRLVQYAMRGEEKVGKGGIIMELDNSGSMSGDPEVWAKAVGLAMAAIAREQKRSFYGVHFGARQGWRIKGPELKCFDFRDWSKVDYNQLIDYAEFFWGGGTDFEMPLTKALQILQEEEREKGFTEGDICFVTDGICAVSPQWMKEFKEEQERLKFRIWGVIIGGQRTSEPLWTICDGNVVTITDLLSGNEVREMFREL